ncbi:2-isopropylmalate synthase [Kitasatospora sp. NPDC057936]|uniref:2-isopropylmalate synthase n=1 Tax=Kitasatospora sp. NPDC057936 TaxID=3346283 RepID=UPI0036DCB927
MPVPTPRTPTSHATPPHTTPSHATPSHATPRHTTTLRAPAGPVPAGAPAWNPQRGGTMPSHRYRPAHERVHVPALLRRWPGQRIERAPLWVPVDLRDGNQALAEPMDPARKQRMFDLFLAMGFKEIEVGYPSASRADFDFVRQLATVPGAVPEDVTIVVFTAARADLIDRTFEAVEGLPRVVVHLYTATAPVWRDVVLGRGREEVRELIVGAAEHMARRAEGREGVRFQFSPEVFNLTEPDYVLEVCNGLTALWDASPDRPVVHNLPATVEIATPNVYADQIEYLHRHLERRESVVLSVHPHNDRGTGVACAELAVLAGAQRVEGCLFGNGERTGNVDLVTLALNLHTQGVDPMLDLSDIDAVRRTVEHCNRLPVPERHPYAGDLVHTAFSGTHQDAIRKGLAHHAKVAAGLGVPEREAPWDVPYLPIDPADLGRDYEAVIRVNSQSGKGGIAYLLQTGHGLELPRRLQIEFSRVVQEATDDSGREVTGEELYALFRTEYLDAAPPWAWTVTGDRAEVDGRSGTGSGPLDAVADALGVEILHFSEHAVGSGPDAVAYVEARVGDEVRWGAGRDASVLTAGVRAVLSAVGRARGVEPGARG